MNAEELDNALTIVGTQRQIPGTWVPEQIARRNIKQEFINLRGEVSDLTSDLTESNRQCNLLLEAAGLDDEGFPEDAAEAVARMRRVYDEIHDGARTDPGGIIGDFCKNVLVASRLQAPSSDVELVKDEESVKQ